MLSEISPQPPQTGGRRHEVTTPTPKNLGQAKPGAGGHKEEKNHKAQKRKKVYQNPYLLFSWFSW
jgi:hypothetical protein